MSSAPHVTCFPLDEDLLAAILSLLPPAALAAAEAVCRRWSGLVEEHGCWRRHAHAVLLKLGPKAPTVCSGWLDGGGLELAHWKQRYLEAQWCLVFGATGPSYHTRSVLVERAHTAAVTCLSSLSVSGGRWLASASADGSVSLWGVEARLVPLCHAQHPGPVLFVQLQSPETAVSACANAAYLWRIEPMAEANAGSSAAGAAAREGQRQARESSEAGGATGGSCGGSNSGSGAPSQRSVGKQQERKENPPPFRFRLLRRIPFERSGCSSGRTRALCAAAWDNWLAAGCEDGSVRLYDTYSGRCTKLLRLHPARVTALQHVRHGALDLLVSGSNAAGRVSICDAESSVELAHATLHQPGMSGLHLHVASGRLLVVSGAHHSSAGSLWLCTAGRQLCNVPSPTARLRMADSAQLPVARLQFDSSRITAVAVPRYGSSTAFFCGNHTGDVRVLSPQCLEEQQRFRLPGLQPPVQQQRPDAQAQQHRAGERACEPSAVLNALAATEQERCALAQQQQQGHQPERGMHSERALPASAQPYCTCICADVPLVAGCSDGRLVLWRWRRRPAPLQPAAQQAGAGVQVAAGAAHAQGGLQEFAAAGPAG